MATAQSAVRDRRGLLQWFTPARLFLAFGPLLYVAFALITPPFQTPDEHQHLFRAWQLASFQLHGERVGAAVGGEVPRGLAAAATLELGTAAPYVDRHLRQTSWDERSAQATPVDASHPVFADFAGSAAYSPAGYVPQVAAIWIGQVAGLSVEAILRLGRVFNAMLAAWLLYGAMRTLPAGRLVLLVIALLPMTAACAGSFGQDGLVIGTSAWLVALGMRAAVDGVWQRRDGMQALILTIALGLAKFVYLPLIGLGLFARAGTRRLPVAAIPLVSGLLAAGVVGLWMFYTRDLFGQIMPGRPAPGVQAAWLLDHPPAFLRVLAETYDARGTLWLVQKLFTFGLLNVGPVGQAIPLTLIALLLALFAGDRNAERLTAAWRIWALLVCGVVLVLLSLALYLTATPLRADYVHGLQGRYYIPLLLPALCCLLLQRSRPWPLAPTGVSGLMVTANLVSLSAMFHAWYG